MTPSISKCSIKDINCLIASFSFPSSNKRVKISTACATFIFFKESLGKLNKIPSIVLKEAKNSFPATPVAFPHALKSPVINLIALLGVEEVNCPFGFLPC